MRIATTVLAFLLALPLPAIAETVRLPKSTSVTVRLLDSAWSGTRRQVRAEVAEHVVNPNGDIIIQAGTPVDIDVERVRRGRRGKPGELLIVAESTTSYDGQTVDLEGDLEAFGENKRVKSLAPVVLLFFLPPVYLSMMMKGGAAYVESGSEFQATTLRQYASRSGSEFPERLSMHLTSWTALEQEMVFERVQEVLGMPDEVERIGNKMKWKYGTGHVMFDHRGKAESWELPTHSW